MSTAGDLATEIQRRLISVSGKERLNSLSAAATTGATQITLNYTEGTIDRGALLAVGSELMHVWHVNDRTVHVKRAMHGTTAVNHADDSLVEIEPRWPKGVILQEMKRELQSLPRAIFKVATASVSVATDTNATDFTSMSGVDIYRLLEVKTWDPNNPDDGARILTGTRLLRNMPTDVFASGYALQIPNGARTGQALTLRVTYATTLTTSTLTDSTDLQTTVGLPATAEDILVYGVAARMLMDHEAMRLDLSRQGQQRHAEEVPPRSWLQVADYYKQRRDERIAEEGIRLLGLYPQGER